MFFYISVTELYSIGNGCIVRIECSKLYSVLVSVQTDQRGFESRQEPPTDHWTSAQSEQESAVETCHTAL